MSDFINTDGSVPDPLSPAFAVKPEDVKVQRVGPWQSAGDWKWREFGREVQLRNKRLPHLLLDMYRGELEALAFAVGLILSRPMPLPYRVGPWERFKMWLARKTWNRRHAAELDEARAVLVAELAAKAYGPGELSE